MFYSYKERREGKKGEKPWYQYVFLAVDIRSDATGGRQAEDLNAVAGSCVIAAVNS